MPTIKELRSGLTAEKLHEILDYDRITGVFRWRISRRSRTPVGTVAGGFNGNGYITIKIIGYIHLAHRLAWLHVYGQWAIGDIDHKDTIRNHNWIDNLRLATNAQNHGNMPRSRANRSGFKGVSFHSKEGRWRAVVRHNYKSNHIGYFDTPEEAHVAYVARARELFGEFSNPG